MPLSPIPAAIVAFLMLAVPSRVLREPVADPCAGLVLGPRMECGSLTVPEDRTRSNGRTIPIRYLVVRARTPGNHEPLFLFAGGPGQGSTEERDLADGPFAPVNQTRDVVMVDQRGTGGSNMLGCPVDLVAQPALAFGHVFDPAVFRACRTQLEQRADLRLYTTESAIKDVDQVRAHLGYDRILLWGGSYGTRIAQAYLRAYPQHVLAAVLDGVVPFDFAAPSGYARSLQQSLERVFADCRAATSCRTRYRDLPRAFGRLLDRFGPEPIRTTIRRRSGSPIEVAMTRGDFGYAVRGLLYSSRAARRLPEMIQTADRTGDLSVFAQAYWNRAASFNNDFADGLHFAIFCAEDVPFINEDAVPDLVEGTFLGRYLINEYSTVCHDWVRAPVGPATREPLRTNVPVLLVSGWFDPVTPPETAERVVAHLTNGRHLVVRNEAHGAGFDCARPAVLHVLREGTVDGLPPVCQGVKNLFAR